MGINKGKVKLHLTGTHDLTLQPEKDNKIIIDNETISGTITIEIFPQGQELAHVSFEGGSEFVFLTDNRLHIEYPSLAHSIRDEKLNVNLLNLFDQDDSISLNTVAQVNAERNPSII